MHQEVLTLARLKSINIKHVSVYDMIDRLADEEIKMMFEVKWYNLKEDGRLD